MTPKEDPEAKKARERDRQIAARERTSATQDLASGMTSDLQRLYGMPRFSAFGMSR